DAGGRAHEHAPLAFLTERVVIAYLGDGNGMPQVARTGLKDAFKLLLVEHFIEVAGHGQLRAAAGKGVESRTQVGHDPQVLQKPMSTRKLGAKNNAEGDPKNCGGTRHSTQEGWAGLAWAQDPL